MTHRLAALEVQGELHDDVVRALRVLHRFKRKGVRPGTAEPCTTIPPFQATLPPFQTTFQTIPNNLVSPNNIANILRRVYGRTHLGLKLPHKTENVS